MMNTIARSGTRPTATAKPSCRRLDETTLQQIASAGNGIYVRASTGQDGLGRILDEINALGKTGNRDKDVLGI